MQSAQTVGTEGDKLMAALAAFIKDAEARELEQAAQIESKRTLVASLENYHNKNRELAGQLDIVTNAVAILNKISDDTVGASYEFIKENLNTALARVFDKSPRQINLREYTRGGTYPQLEVEVITEGGVTRSLKDDSGHGISQIISLLCILSLIVITGQRRFLVLDEMLSGLSSNAAMIVSDILWAFADIGFQFVISEHGLVVKGSHVYYLESRAGISTVKEHYIEPAGVYLDGSLDSRAKKAKTKAKEDGYDEAQEALEEVAGGQYVEI